VIGLISRQEKKADAYVWYILITIGWFFIWGPFAIFTFVELIVGDAPVSIVNKGYVPTRKHQAKLVNRSRYNPKNEVIDSGQYCSYDEWLRLGYQVTINKTPMITSSKKNSSAIYYDGCLVYCYTPSLILSEFK
jgi:hypothetical protein